jgi:hypothetical protein
MKGRAGEMLNQWEPGWVKLNTGTAFCTELGIHSRAGLRREGTAAHGLERNARLWISRASRSGGMPGRNATIDRVGAATDDGGDGLPELDQRGLELTGGLQILYRHVHRGANEVAHTLAQRAKRCHENVVVHLEAPECVRELIRREG